METLTLLTAPDPTSWHIVEESPDVAALQDAHANRQKRYLRGSFDRRDVPRDETDRRV